MNDVVVQGETVKTNLTQFILLKKHPASTLAYPFGQ